MGDVGAAPMQVEIEEDDARGPTSNFNASGENILSKI